MQNIYQFTENYIKNKYGGIVPSQYISFITGGGHLRPAKNLNDVYSSILGSAQNKQGMGNSIKFWEGATSGKAASNFLEIKRILCDFDVSLVCSMYNSGEDIYNAFKESLVLIKGIFGKHWSDFSKTAFQAAILINNSFKTFVAFQDFCNGYTENANNIKKVALPEFFANNIYGLGFALASDFLKELGYDYPKPDVHIKDVYDCLIGHKLRSDKEYCLRLMESAIISKVTSYQLDKILWVVCSRGCMNDKSNFESSVRENLMTIVF